MDQTRSVPLDKSRGVAPRSALPSDELSGATVRSPCLLPPVSACCSCVVLYSRVFALRGASVTGGSAMIIRATVPQQLQHTEVRL